MDKVIEEKIVVSQKEYERIHQMLESKRYADLGEMGILQKAFDEINVKYELLTMNLTEGIEDVPSRVGLIIPPSNTGFKNVVAVFSFSPEYKYQETYFEDAIAMGMAEESL